MKSEIINSWAAESRTRKRKLTNKSYNSVDGKSAFQEYFNEFSNTIIKFCPDEFKSSSSIRNNSLNPNSYWIT